MQRLLAVARSRRPWPSVLVNRTGTRYTDEVSPPRIRDPLGSQGATYRRMVARSPRNYVSPARAQWLPSTGRDSGGVTLLPEHEDVTELGG